MDVVVAWPYQLSQTSTEGAPNGLLYLTEAPEITPPGVGQCFINSRRINSLGLRQSRTFAKYKYHRKKTSSSSQQSRATTTIVRTSKTVSKHLVQSSQSSHKKYSYTSSQRRKRKRKRFRRSVRSTRSGH